MIKDMTEIFIFVLGFTVILVVFFFMLRAKAKFQNKKVAKLIFVRAILSLIYITVMYYFITSSVISMTVYISILAVILILFIVIDRLISKSAKSGSDK